MAILKIKNQQGGWDEIIAIRGRDGAIQYTAGANIEISPDNVISAKGLENTVTREDVTEMINTSVPQKVSDLTNDAGYVTSASIPTKLSDLTNDAGYITSADVPKVPTKTSELTNDSGFVNSSAIPTKTSELTNDSNFATLNDIPTVPTKLSELTNDSGYLQYNDVGTGLLTIKRNDIAIGTFNANETVNKTVNIVVPTATAELTNDSGFITAGDVPDSISDLNDDVGIVKQNNVLTDLNNKIASLDQYKTTKDTDVLSRFAFLNFMRKKRAGLNATFISTNLSSYVGARIWFYIEGNMVHMLGDVHFDGTKGPKDILVQHNILFKNLVANVNVVADNIQGYETINLFDLFRTDGGLGLGSDRHNGNDNTTRHLDYMVPIPATLAYVTGSYAETIAIGIQDSGTDGYILYIPINYIADVPSGSGFPYVQNITFEAWAHFPCILYKDSRWN